MGGGLPLPPSIVIRRYKIMSKYTKKGEREIISVATFIFFQQAHNGGLCKFIEKDNLDQSTRYFKKEPLIMRQTS